MKSKLSIYRSRYVNFLIIPEDTRKVRKLRLSENRIRLILLSLMIGLGLALASVGGFFHYHSLYVQFKEERNLNLKFASERGHLLQRLTDLEGVVESAKKFANNLAMLVGTERPTLRTGIGPVKGLQFDPLSGGEAVTWDELTEKVHPLEDEARSVELRLQELVKIQEDKLLYLASKPSIWPLKGWVTSEFGNRRSPISGGREFHYGMDIAAQWGAPIYAPAAGVVRFAGVKQRLGRAVIVDHGYGIRTHFGHTAQLLVRPGQIVKRGALLARVGSSGFSTGPHLHYEIHIDGVPIDPMKYILQ